MALATLRRHQYKRAGGGKILVSQRRVDVMKQETLAWTLRYKLGLAGTKLGCDRAECGACTVLIEDVPHYSCSVLLDRDARDSLAALELVLARPVISSRLIDNLNASIHLRALLTDMFLVGEIIAKQHPVVKPGE